MTNLLLQWNVSQNMYSLIKDSSQLYQRSFMTSVQRINQQHFPEYDHLEGAGENNIRDTIGAI